MVVYSGSTLSMIIMMMMTDITWKYFSFKFSEIWLGLTLLQQKHDECRLEALSSKISAILQNYFEIKIKFLHTWSYSYAMGRSPPVFTLIQVNISNSYILSIFIIYVFTIIFVMPCLCHIGRGPSEQVITHS